MALLFIPTRFSVAGVTTAQAVFTQEQMDRVVNDLKVCTRKINAETKRFVSDSEWLVIDQVREAAGGCCAATKRLMYGKLGAAFSLLLVTCSPAGFARSISSFTLDRCSVWFVESA